MRNTSRSFLGVFICAALFAAGCGAQETAASTQPVEGRLIVKVDGQMIRDLTVMRDLNEAERSLVASTIDSVLAEAPVGNSALQVELVTSGAPHAPQVWTIAIDEHAADRVSDELLQRIEGQAPKAGEGVAEASCCWLNCSCDRNICCGYFECCPQEP